MNMDRRKELRFPVSLKVAAKEVNRDSIFGQIKDFSRSGLRAVFDDFESESEDYVDLKIEIPNADIFVPASVEVRWKKPVEDKWEVGFRFNDFVPQLKAEILDYSYKRWLEDAKLAA